MLSSLITFWMKLHHLTDDPVPFWLSGDNTEGFTELHNVDKSTYQISYSFQTDQTWTHEQSHDQM